MTKSIVLLNTNGHPEPTAASGDLCVAVKDVGMRPGDLQIKDVRIEANDDTVLFAKSGHLRGVLVERTQREEDGYFVHDVVTQKFGDARIVTSQPEAACFELVQSCPVVIHETEQPVAAFRGRLNAPSKLDGASVRPENNKM